MFNKPLSGILQRYVIFLMLFLGAGFVAGSVVHFGEGVTVWDASVLGLGVVLFVGGSIWQDQLDAQHSQRPLRAVLRVIVTSLFLSLTVGMASGGTQHFIDTPLYAAWLIPLGLTLGFLAFLFKQGLSFTLRTYGSILACLVLIGIGLHLALRWADGLLPDSLRVGHGSHSLQHQAPQADTGVVHSDEGLHGDDH